MKIGNTGSVKGAENKGRPKCPLCGRNLKPTEIKALREGKIVVCGCEGKEKKK